MVEELQLNKFKNLKVLITGVSSGIGLAVAKSYLKMGSLVFGLDTNQKKNLKPFLIKTGLIEKYVKVK